MLTTGRDLHDHFHGNMYPAPVNSESATLRSRCVNQDSNARPATTQATTRDYFEIKNTDV